MVRRAALFTAVAVLALTAVAVYLLARPGKDGAGLPPPRAFPLSLVDDEGVTVTVTSAPQRIVVAAPHLTEFLFAAGVGDKVVGATSAELRPPEARVLPSVIASDGITPDPVRIGELAPDLVIVSGFAGAQWKDHIRNTGTSIASFDATGVEDALADMKKVGELSGAERASKVLSAIRRKVDEVTQKVKARTGPRVFVESFYPPLIGVGPGGFTGDLVKHAGGVVVAPTGAAQTFPWTIADLAAADPDVYLAPATTAQDVEALGSRNGFERLRALRDKRAHVISDDTLFSPGPRLADSLGALARLFHPGLT